MAEVSSTYNRLALLPSPDKCVVKLNKRFALIVPPSPFVVPTGWEWTHTAPFEGPSVISSVLRGLGFEVKLIDLRDDFNPEHARERIKGYDLIGLACYEDSFPFQKRIIEICKEENPDSFLILGGPLVTSIPKVILENTKADFAVMGEGELTLIELTDLLLNNEYALPVDQIEGLAWRDEDNNITLNKARRQMQNLDAVPFQDFSVWERFNGKEIPEIYLSTTRGCPHACSFCYRAMPAYREKSVKKVKEEILFLTNYRFKHAWINDLTFNVDENRSMTLLDEAFSVYKFSWNSFNRVTNTDAKVLSKMKEKGCDIILYGFEAISQNILDSYRKGITRNDMINAITLTREAGIKVGGLFIIGAPGETKESLENIINFCREFKEVTRVKYLSALPGTPLYHQALREGYIKDEIAHLDFLAREQSIEEDIDEEGFLFMAPDVTREELRKAYHDINHCIEVRPYRYSVAENTYLDEGSKFIKRI